MQRKYSFVCANCATPFESLSPRRVFCSPVCGREYRAKNFPALFWSYVDKPPDNNRCWNWLAYTSPYGYGQIHVPYKGNRQAHTIAYELTYGAIPAGKEVMHSCDNRRCCNPAHLSLSTHKQNMHDMKVKGRAAHNTSANGEDSKNAKLTWANVDDIRREYAQGRSQRSLARKYNVSPRNISFIVHNKHWRRDYVRLAP